jgi:hypothetical protein
VFIGSWKKICQIALYALVLLEKACSPVDVSFSFLNNSKHEFITVRVEYIIKALFHQFRL